MTYQFNNIQFYYADKLALALDQVTIEQGKTTALIGANGSGKSTLLLLCAFLESPKQGELLFMGQPVNRSDLTLYRRRVGFLAQKPFMLRGTVLDNMDLALKIHGKKQRAEKIWRVLQQLDIKHCAKQQAKQLSGGELQKAALARLLVLEPDVLLLDEPFSYLDQSSAQSLELFLRNYTQASGQTLVFSTHDRLQGFALADQVLALAQGKRVHSPLINLFSGFVHEHVFHSGALRIILPEGVVSGQHASINPQDIVLSADALVSSMGNCIQGRIMMMAEEGASILVNVDTGVIFQVLITYQTLHELNIRLGDKIWVNFKSNSVVVF
ncbi:MAG: ABC transporter ATP-binding protein [Methyloprofundus sp.]|nr:ABC transporter ATP-binding protein [Methyloprofundus sp.]MDT8424429.1 ABC transporter ATP-binding protein [Methyloprofundus sp.]